MCLQSGLRDVHPLSTEGCRRAGDGGPRSLARADAECSDAHIGRKRARAPLWRLTGWEGNRWSAWAMGKLGPRSGGERGAQAPSAAAVSAPRRDKGSTLSALSGWPRRPEGDWGARLRAHLASGFQPETLERDGQVLGALRSEWHEGLPRTRRSGDAGAPQAPPRGRRPDNASGPGGAAAPRPSAGTRRGWDQSAAAAAAARAELLCRAGPGAGPGPGVEGGPRPSLHLLPS